jgi:hypothetical protein
MLGHKVTRDDAFVVVGTFHYREDAQEIMDALSAAKVGEWP